jgi:hypothetical protein
MEYHCDDLSVEHARECISLLRQFDPIEINATAAEEYLFLFPKWLTADDFLHSFPDCVAPTFYGDLIIRSA